MPITEEWLKKINQEFRGANMEPRKRPWEALRRYSLEFKASFSIDSLIAKTIFAYFEANSKPGAHHIGALYESVYFFDAQFWPVSIPLSFGTVRLDCSVALEEMPEAVKTELLTTPKLAWDYVMFWADCVDYGMGISELDKRKNLHPFGLELLKAGDQELRSAVSQLKEKSPDSRSILNCRLATEIFLKSYIALKAGLTEGEAKKFGHDLGKLFDRFIEVSGFTEWKNLKSKLDVFPEIHGRYNEQSVPLADVWNGFVFAQSLGTVIVREHTKRNTAAQVLASNKKA